MAKVGGRIKPNRRRRKAKKPPSASFSGRNNQRIYELEGRTGRTGARSLFAKMNEKADKDPAYGKRLEKWLRRGGGSTVTLRELAAPFGNYSGDLTHANNIFALDAARAGLSYQRRKKRRR